MTAPTRAECRPMNRRSILAAVGGVCVGRLARAAPPGAPRSLFDGKTLAGWKATVFGGEGKVAVEKGQIILQRGAPLTGITWAGGPPELPRMSYEVSLDAMKVDGSDFFCGLTFPVGPDPCSFIVGGWGGGVVGLSSLDGMDASE